MNKTKKNTPELRFPGFTDAWEQRKLKDLAESFEYGLNAAAKEYDGKNKYLRITDINDDTREFMCENLTSPDTDLSNAGNYELKEGDILFARTGASVGKSYIYKDSDGLVYYAGFLIRARIKSEYDAEFVFQNTLTSNYEKYIQITSQRSGQPGVNAQEYADYPILVPSYNEQVKIGEFLSSLDNTITLHQRKLDEIKEFKKGMLQKMFPKKGESVPEIRFPGFTDAWEQRKLSELLEKYEDPVETPNNGYERIGIRSHAKGIFHSFVEPGKELSTAKMHRVAAGKFILNITFAWEHAVAITEESDAGALVSHRFPQFSFDPKLKAHFFKYLMLDKKFREHLELSSPGGAGRNRVLKISDMLKYEIRLPSVEEQVKIGAFFDNLDSLITLHQRKLDGMKEYKKGMLQKMFV